MRKRTLLTLAVLLCLVSEAGCSDWDQEPSESPSPPPAGAAGPTTEVMPLDLVREMIAEVNQERILADLRRLTGVEQICTNDGCYTITGRETGSAGLQWAKDYVVETLLSLNYPVELHDWSRDGFADQNIIARKQGLAYPGEEIVFIAHLDGYPQNSPAANDDATGVVSLLELARILSGRLPSRTVVIFFSTGEEHGALGARSYVDQMTPEQIAAIQYLVSAEMLGYDSDDDGKMELWSGNEQGDFQNQLAEIIAAYQLGLKPEVFTDCY